MKSQRGYDVAWTTCQCAQCGKRFTPETGEPKTICGACLDIAKSVGRYLEDNILPIAPTSIRTEGDENEPRNAAYWKRQCRKAWAEIERLNTALKVIASGSIDISPSRFARLCAYDGLAGFCDKCGNPVYHRDGAGEDYAHDCTKTPNA